MFAETHTPTDPSFATLDADATVELCGSLADYGEAGGLSRELMLRVGRFGETRYGDNLEVLLAVARMYVLGGEALRAKAILVRAGKLTEQDPRLDRLVSHVQGELKQQHTPEPSVPDAGGPSPTLQTAADPAPRDKGASAKLESARPGRPAASAVDRAATVKMESVRPGRSAHPPASDRTATVKMESVRPASDRAATVKMESVRPDGLAQPPSLDRAPTLRVPAGPPGRSTPRARPAMGLDAVRSETPVEDPVLPSSSEGPAVAPAQTVDRSGSASPRAPASVSAAPRSASGSPRSLRMRLLDRDDPQRRLDPYELIAEIASGGMATVFLGRLAGVGGFQRLVAIKRLHPHLANDEQFVDMFLDEARIAAAIHNPHVVPILEVGTSAAGYFLVMEFIEGDTLARLVGRQLATDTLIPPQIVLRIVHDALMGLHAAHQLADGEGRLLGLVHRDCTPQNILVGLDGSARITDFGVARAASRLAISRPHQVKGKVGYLSPEQAQGHDVDRRSDVFTMGIVLWETLTGRALFQADTDAATLARVLSGSVPPIRTYVRETPPAIDDVCRRALSRDPGRRYRTAGEMAEAIDRASRAAYPAGFASAHDLARYIRSLMGADIAAQREAVRGWIAQGEPPAMSRTGRAATGSFRVAVGLTDPTPEHAVEAANARALDATAATTTPVVAMAHVGIDSADRAEHTRRDAAPPFEDGKLDAPPSVRSSRPGEQADPAHASQAVAPPVGMGVTASTASARTLQLSGRAKLLVVAALALIATSPLWLSVLDEALIARKRPAAIPSSFSRALTSSTHRGTRSDGASGDDPVPEASAVPPSPGE